MAASWDGTERRVGGQLGSILERRGPSRLEANEARRAELVAMAGVPMPLWDAPRGPLELERAAWVETRMALLEAFYPVAIVARDVLDGAETGLFALDVDEAARRQSMDPATNYGAW